MNTINRISKPKPRINSVSLESSKDVFPSTEMSLPATAGNEGAAELVPFKTDKKINVCLEINQLTPKIYLPAC